MKKFMKEFKEFISRGNVLEMAIGVILATSFGKITAAMVSNVLTPLLAWIFKAPNPDALNITLRAATETEEAIVLGLGTLVGAIVDFIVIAFVIFLIVKAMNKARAAAEAKKAKEEAKPAEPAGPTTEELLTKILAELQKKK